MHAFDHDTQLSPTDRPEAQGATELRLAGTVSPAWNIGDKPNGGYLLALAAQGLRRLTPQQPDPLSISAHYLRPGQPGQACTVDTQLLRSGRTLSTVRGTLAQADGVRLEVLAAMGRLAGPQPPTTPPPLSLRRPDIPPPEDCLPRSGAAQGVDLAILQQLDIRLNPAEAQPGHGNARVSGWVRFADGRAPDALACLLMADAFPPAVFGLLGLVGWVPTIELTVQLRRHPAPGWLLGSFWTEDLCDGRLVEDGALWDSHGQLVAQSRQLALLRQPGA